VFYAARERRIESATAPEWCLLFSIHKRCQKSDLSRNDSPFSSRMVVFVHRAESSNAMLPLDVFFHTRSVDLRYVKWRLMLW